MPLIFLKKLALSCFLPQWQIANGFKTMLWRYLRESGDDCCILTSQLPTQKHTAKINWRKQWKFFVQSCTSSKYFVYMKGIDDFDQDLQANKVMAILRVN